MLRFPAPRRAAVVGVLGLALFAGACSNQGSATESQSQAAPAATTPMASSEPFGAACSTVPTSGPGSLAGMAKDPVATAASNNPALSTLVTAVQKAGLVDTLNSAEGITVFAPTNDAFAKLPAGTVDTLLKPENKPALTKVLTYHVVPGKLSSMDLKKQIEAGNGTATLKTVSGGMLWASLKGNDVMLKDEKGGWSKVTQANVFQSNGVIHVVDTVVLPN
jgi:uncharacterized surface protein with fasciclin (FAS1) repeats